jgi:hypothetical protein
VHVIATLLALHVTLVAPNHTPKINTHWGYSVTATLNGKPAKAKLTLQIVDPIGGVHVVERGPNTQKLKSWPFSGTYRDYIIWPPESRDIQLRLRATVTAGGEKKVVTFAVTPHS